MLNPEKMKRVVFNLVTNAVKFSKQDSTIILSAKAVGNKVFIEVSDNGIGIPKKLIPEILNISNSGIRKGTDGKGSTFTVELPLT